MGGGQTFLMKEEGVIIKTATLISMQDYIIVQRS